MTALFFIISALSPYTVSGGDKMMKYFQKQFSYAQIVFAILSLIAGVLLHFVYDWTGGNYLAGHIAPVNESTWEHLKLLFFPVLFLSVFEYFYVGRLFPAFITARTIGCTAGLLFIVVFYYSYTGILGEHYLWMDILSFFLGVALCYGLTWYLTIKKEAGNLCTNIFCILFLLFLAGLFFYFTDYPPDIPLFYAME